MTQEQYSNEEIAAAETGLRRNNYQLMTFAEAAITDALDAVMAMPINDDLILAKTNLIGAKSRISNFVDANPLEPTSRPMQIEVGAIVREKDGEIPMIVRRRIGHARHHWEVVTSQLTTAAYWADQLVVLYPARCPAVITNGSSKRSVSDTDLTQAFSGKHESSANGALLRLAENLRPGEERLIEYARIAQAFPAQSPVLRPTTLFRQALDRIGVFELSYHAEDNYNITDEQDANWRLTRLFSTYRDRKDFVARFAARSPENRRLLLLIAEVCQSDGYLVYDRYVGTPKRRPSSADE